MLELSLKTLTILNIIIGILLIIHIGMTQSTLTELRNKQGPTGDRGDKGNTGPKGSCENTA